MVNKNKIIIAQHISVFLFDVWRICKLATDSHVSKYAQYKTRPYISCGIELGIKVITESIWQNKKAIPKRYDFLIVII
tara:strand:- start:374 stop:607 length:234 start_codon:yes stop_codon:yes gene_type:complete